MFVFMSKSSLNLILSIQKKVVDCGRPRMTNSTYQKHQKHQKHQKLKNIKNMEDLTARMENATVNMSRIFSEKKGDVGIFRYLGDKDREFSARKLMELHFDKEYLEVQRQRCNDMLGRYQVLVNLGVELDMCMKIEIRQYVSRLSRQDEETLGVQQRVQQQAEDQLQPACTGCDNCFR